MPTITVSGYHNTGSTCHCFEERNKNYKDQKGRD